MTSESGYSAGRAAEPDARRTEVLMRTFGERLRAWRTHANLTQKVVAANLGVSIAIVCEWEHGHRFPSARHIDALTRYTNVPFCCFLYSGTVRCPARRPKWASSASRLPHRAHCPSSRSCGSVVRERAFRRATGKMVTSHVVWTTDRRTGSQNRVSLSGRSS